jgi:hypothetical protein
MLRGARVFVGDTFARREHARSSRTRGELDFRGFPVGSRRSAGGAEVAGEPLRGYRNLRVLPETEDLAGSAGGFGGGRCVVRVGLSVVKPWYVTAARYTLGA